MRKLTEKNMILKYQIVKSQNTTVLQDYTIAPFLLQQIVVIHNKTLYF